ncbi:hypothetical protein SBV45_03825 [Chlamydia crocodili]|uniref:Inner membrane protein n=1 Tax=Chlamydia crocodili TaxID=2766982 RepID=A0ABX8CDM5_9CHLA|nr:hypothetical protein [Chlamydia crocodili]QVE49115.1 hypothetical protein H9Q19_00085 [Chlamydia crocodili]
MGLGRIYSTLSTEARPESEIEDRYIDRCFHTIIGILEIYGLGTIFTIIKIIYFCIQLIVVTIAGEITELIFDEEQGFKVRYFLTSVFTFDC